MNQNCSWIGVLIDLRVVQTLQGPNVSRTPDPQQHSRIEGSEALIRQALGALAQPLAFDLRDIVLANTERETARQELQFIVRTFDHVGSYP